VGESAFIARLESAPESGWTKVRGFRDRVGGHDPFRGL